MIAAILSILLFLSILANTVLVLYSKSIVRQFMYASENASEIFTRLQSFKKHLETIYELKMFYGDKNLKEVVDHTEDLLNFLKKYNEIYSFSQPELEEVLKDEDELEENNND